MRGTALRGGFRPRVAAFLVVLVTAVLAVPAPAEASGGDIIVGDLGGPAVGIPFRSGWAGKARYGTLPEAGVRFDNIHTMSEIRDYARNAPGDPVPWPSHSGKNLEETNFSVYQIFGKWDNGTTRLWKYGITRSSRGYQRPREQLPACRRYMRNQGDTTPSCSWTFLRIETDRRWEARQVEAAYFTGYKYRRGQCPPGARSCI